ncbi:MAG: ThiF family adenylyltransferase, partial [Candidatus Aminicenantes bacterium]
DGTIEFLGRIDTQVKVRGYRIELKEIESRLMKHKQVEEALVVVKDAEEENKDKYLCAYIVPKGEKIKDAVPPAANKKLINLKEIAGKENFAGPWQDLPGLNKDQPPPSIVDCFESMVTRNPDKIILESDGQPLTYQALNRYANQVAHKILKEYDDKYKLSKSERTRYKRQMLLHGWGMAAQEKLKGTTVFVAGAGGGASPTITQLALVGLGTIKVCDFDQVELSNLNRQFLHDEERLGINKALSAKLTISKTNPNINVIPYTGKLTRENIAEQVGDAAIIFDMFDGPADKFILSQYAVAKGIPHLILAMTDINAYAMVCHTPHTPCYHCIFDKKKLEAIVTGMQNYVENYSKNPLPVVSTSLFISAGIIVNEALKILLGFDKPAYNKFFYFNQRGATPDLVLTPGYKAMTHLFSEHFLGTCKEQGFDWDVGWSGNFLEELKVEPDPNCPLCGVTGAKKRKTPEEQIKKTKLVPTAIEIKEEKKSKNKNHWQTIALLLNHDIPMAAGVMGALKSGKTYVPLDPTVPRERLTHILEDSESRIILTDNEYHPLAEKIRDKVNKNIKVINISSPDGLNDSDPGIAGENPAIEIAPDQAAYLLYSPGPPRDLEAQEYVIESHKDVLDFSRVYAYHWQANPGKKTRTVLSTASYSINAGLAELYAALLYGNGPYASSYIPYTFESNKRKSRSNSLVSELREYLQEELPDYMVPAYFIQLEKIPLTPNGKVDMRALPGPGIEQGEEAAIIAPRNEVEEKLAKIWAEVLGIEKDAIGIHTNFFEIGGHSLNAAIMVARVQKELDLRLSLAEVFEMPFIKEIASLATVVDWIEDQKEIEANEEEEEITI